MTAQRYCGDCGYWHPFADCGPDPDGSYPCRAGHYGCAVTLRGRCRAELAAREDLPADGSDSELTDSEWWARFGKV